MQDCSPGYHVVVNRWLVNPYWKDHDLQEMDRKLQDNTNNNSKPGKPSGYESDSEDDGKNWERMMPQNYAPNATSSNCSGNSPNYHKRSTNFNRNSTNYNRPISYSVNAPNRSSNYSENAERTDTELQKLSKSCYQQ